jgi:Leucine-rich repeat (LRR) protein
VQRFALLSLDFALFSSNESPNGDEIVVDGEDDEGTPNGSFFSSTRNNVFAQEVMPNWGMRNQDECFWKGVICNVLDEVTEIRLADKGITGSIATEVGLLSSLLHLDISNNKVTGTIPEEIYDISGLKQIFLYHNKLEGTISTNIGNLRSITHYHVSNNQLTGKIPETMKSNEDGIFPIRK